jgi:hypothetical protein
MGKKEVNRIIAMGEIYELKKKQAAGSNDYPVEVWKDI